MHQSLMHQSLQAIFTAPHAAEQAIDRLLALGIPLESIHTVGAIDRASVGSFADTETDEHTAARASVGGFADTETDEHTAARASVGSFADTETDDDVAERASPGSFASGELKPISATETISALVAAGLSPADAAANAPRLADGAVLVFVTARADQADAVMGALRQ